MADVNARIGIDIDASDALAQLKSLQRQLSQFHTSIARSSDAAAAAQRSMQKNLIDNINSLGGFTAELRTVRTTAESFTNSLEKNKFSMREYFRYAAASTKTFGNVFRAEFDTIGKVAEDRVKKLQTQYIKMGRDANGAMRAIAVIPDALNLDDNATRLQLAAQRQQIFNQLVKQGSTNLLNFGKNTQWAGRQLMVGFTIPLMTLGSVASRTFMEMETAALKFRKVYGDLFTPKAETQAALDGITELGRAYTKYGISVAQTVGLAAEAAAAGFQGLDLQRQTEQATRLSILGQIDQQKALETTISLQNAFRMSSEDLADAINFLNAVENQTVTSLDDVTTAIPKAAPVIQQLGGDVRDLAFLLTAMREGGINASEGANALKSGLASIINPTKKASDMLATMGINIQQIVESNRGNLRATVVEFATAMNQLDPLSRARAIEQLFGKFQFARISALLQNVTQTGNQADRVLSLASASVQELADLSSQELGMTAESAMNKFKGAVEDLRFALIPLGETFLTVLTPIVDMVTSLLEKFNNLGDGTKKVIAGIALVLGGIGPIALMTFGLLANGLANIIKSGLFLRNTYLKLTGQSKVLGDSTQYLTMEQIDAAAAAASLDQAHATLTQRFTIEAGAVDRLREAYLRAINASQQFAAANPGMIIPGKLPKFARGGIIQGPGTGTSDSIIAKVSNGEAIIPAKSVSRNPELVNALVAGNIPGFADGLGADGISISQARDKARWYAAPSIILKQTRSMIWDTLQEEMDIVESSAREELSRANVPAEQMGRKIGNLVRRQASHIAEDKTSLDIGNGQVIDIKQWEAKNLVPDLGYVNNYMDTLRKNTTILENFRKTDLSLVANDLGITMEELDMELENLAKGIHPTTRRSASVLKRIAETDPSYQGVATARGLGVRLGGSYYETMDERRYDPTKDASARQAVNRRVERFFSLIKRDIPESVKKVLAIRSPSKEMEKVGQDAGKGLVNGVKSQIDDAKVAGTQVAQGVVSGVTQAGRQRRVAATRAQGPANANIPILGGNVVPAGTQLLPIVPVQRMTEELDNTNNSLGRVARKFSALEQRLTGIGFAASALSGILMMTAGNSESALSRFNEKVFMASNALMAFGMINNLVPGGVIGGVSGRFKTARGFAGAAAAGTLTGRGAGIATRVATAGSGLPGILSKVVPLFGRLAVGVTKFLGPWGLVISAISAGFSLWKIYNKRQEEATQRIEGLGNAARLSEEKIKTLGDIFGVTPVAGRFARGREAKAGTGAEGIVAPGLRSQVEELKANKDFQDKFAKDIKALKYASDRQAAIVLNSISQQLFSSGFSMEMVQSIVTAIQEESGKTDVIIDFKTIDLSQKGGLQALKDSTNKMLREFSKGFMKGGKELEKSTALISAAMTNTIEAISNQFEQGKINAKQFNTAFDEITQSILNMPQPQALIIMNSLMQNLPEDLRTAALGVKDVGTQMMFLRAQALGMDMELIKAATAAQLFLESPVSQEGGLGRAQASTVVSEFERQVKARAALLEEAMKSFNSTTTTPVTGGPGDGELSSLQKAVIARYEKEVEALNKKRDALKEVNDELDRQYEFEKRQQELSKSMVEAKISGDYIGAALLNQQKLFEKTKFDRETRQIELDRKIEELRSRIDEIEAGGKVTAAEAAMLKVATKVSTATEKPKVVKKIETASEKALKDSATKRVAAAEKARKDLEARQKAPKWRFGPQTPDFRPTIDPLNPLGLKNGGMIKVKKYSMGGLIKGPGTSKSDSILGFANGQPIKLSNNEYVVQAQAVRTNGLDYMNALNSGRITPGASSNESSTVYNNITMNVSGVQDPQRAADIVIQKLQTISNKTNRTNSVSNNRRAI